MPWLGNAWHVTSLTSHNIVESARTGALVVSDDTLLNKAMVKRMAAWIQYEHASQGFLPLSKVDSLVHSLCRRGGGLNEAGFDTCPGLQPMEPEP